MVCDRVVGVTVNQVPLVPEVHDPIRFQFGYTAFKFKVDDLKVLIDSLRFAR